nr:uncharacterized protein LOC129167021 [Nothobranchius furzeri]
MDLRVPESRLLADSESQINSHGHRNIDGQLQFIVRQRLLLQQHITSRVTFAIHTKVSILVTFQWNKGKTGTTSATVCHGLPQSAGEETWQSAVCVASGRGNELQLILILLIRGPGDLRSGVTQLHCRLILSPRYLASYPLTTPGVVFHVPPFRILCPPLSIARSLTCLPTYTLDSYNHLLTTSSSVIGPLASSQLIFTQSTTAKPWSMTVRTILPRNGLFSWFSGSGTSFTIVYCFKIPVPSCSCFSGAASLVFLILS